MGVVGQLGLGITQLTSESEPRSAYMWAEVRGRSKGRASDDIFVFQYWPESLTDTENPRYAEKEVPGASHPLYQWTGGGAREISFKADFTAEVDSDSASSSTSTPAGRDTLPSSRYTVDIKGAVAKLKTFTRGEYSQNSLNQATKPPPRLWLVLENSGLGGNTDAILTILKSAPVTYEAWFPSGKPRIVSVQLTFAEVIQRYAGDGEASQIAYIGRSSFEKSAKNYKYRGTVDRVNG